MQVSIESTQGLERRMTVEVPQERVEPELEKRLKEVARNVRMDGFRPGKVPMSLVRQRYGRQIRSDVYDELIRTTYFEALTQQQVHPVSEPRIDLLERDKGMGYTATFEVLPEVKVGDLAGLVIKRPQVEITEEDLDKMIDRLRTQHAQWETADRPAQLGDRVLCSYTCSLGDEELEERSNRSDQLILGSGAKEEDFENGLIGISVGEERVLEIHFSEDYGDKVVAGKAVSYKVSVSELEAPLLPEVDEDFCRKFGVEEGGEAALRADVRTNMEREMKSRIETLVKDQVMDALIARTDMELPTSLVAQEAKSLRDRTLQNLAGSNALPPGFNLPVEMFEESAQRRAKLGLIIAEIVKDHDIKVDAAKVRQRIEDMAETYENPQEVIDYYYGSPELRSGVEGLVLEDQVVDWVLDQVEQEQEPSDFYTLMNKAKS